MMDLLTLAAAAIVAASPSDETWMALFRWTLLGGVGFICQQVWLLSHRQAVYNTTAQSRHDDHERRITAGEGKIEVLHDWHTVAKPRLEALRRHVHGDSIDLE